MYGQAKPAKKQPSVDETLNMHYDRLAMWHKEKLDTDVQWLKGEAPDPTTSPIVVDDELPRDKRVKARKQPETKMSLEDMQKQLPAHKAGEAHLRNILKPFPGEHAKRKPPHHIRLAARVARANADSVHPQGKKSPVRLKPVNVAQSALEKSKQRLAAVEKSKAKKLSTSGFFDDAGSRGKMAVKNIFPPYSGDKFGSNADYSDGFMYRSRIPPPSPPKATEAEVDSVSDDQGDTSYDEGTSTDEEGPVSEDEGTAKMTARQSSQRCAATLRNWSYEKSNLTQMVKEGVVEALADLTSLHDRRTSAYTATVYRNITSRKDLAWQVLAQGGAQQLCVLVSSGSVKAETDAIFALRNLTELSAADTEFVAKHGIECPETLLVEHGIVAAISSALSRKSAQSIVPACVLALYNLTCVPAPYLYIEKVVKACINLATANAAETKRVISQALFNLSNFAQGGVRATLLNDGLMSGCQVLARSSSVQVRLLVAAALSNVASSEDLCLDMVDRNVMVTLKSIAEWPAASAEDEEQNALAKHWCSSAITKLLGERTTRARMVSQSVVKVVTFIAAGSADAKPGNDTCRLLAGAFQELSMGTVEHQRRVVEEGLVRTVSDVLARSDDSTVKKRCTVALCNLLSIKTPGSESNAASTSKLHQNVINSLVKLAEDKDEESRATCALALYNLSCMQETREMAVRQKAIFALSELANSSNPDTCNMCAAALCNLSLEEGNRTPMVDQDAVASVVKLLDRASALKPKALAELQTSAGELELEFIDEAAVDDRIHEAVLLEQRLERKLEADPQCHEGHKLEEAKASLLRLRVAKKALGAITCVHNCVSTLCNLSESESGNRVALVKQNAIPSIIEAATHGGSRTINSCCVVLANITYEVAAQENGAQKRPEFGTQLKDMHMIEKVLEFAGQTDFGSGEVHEDVVVDMRRRCTTAICNLSCDPKIRKHLIDAGAVPVLGDLSNTYINSANLECARSFCNLACAPEKDGIQKSIVEKGAMPAILMIAMVRSVSMEAKRTCAQALLNLLNDDTMALMVEGGLIKVLASLCRVPDPETSRTCARLVRHLTMSEAGRQAVASEEGPLLTMFRMLKSWYVDAQLDTGNAMCNLLMCASTQSAAVKSGALEKLRDFSAKPRHEPPSFDELIAPIRKEGMDEKPPLADLPRSFLVGDDVEEKSGLRQIVTRIQQRYDAAVGEIIQREGLEPLQKLRDLATQSPPADLQQDPESFDTNAPELQQLLHKQAEGCQEKLRRKIAPEAASGHWRLNESTKLTSKNIVGAEAFDPGIAPQSEMLRSARQRHGGHFHKLFDISRVDLRFNTCDSLLNCIDALRKMFKVTGVINRFDKKFCDCLGWCEVVLLCVEVLEDGAEMVCAIRLTHNMLVEAREASATDMNDIRAQLKQQSVDAAATRSADVMLAALTCRETFQALVGAERWNDTVEQRQLDWSEQVSLALFTVSCAEELRVPIVKGGALPLLVVLASSGDKLTVKSCVDALVNMAWDDNTCDKLIAAGAMDALLELTKMSDDPFVLYGISRVFCYLARHAPNRLPMIQSGVVGSFIQIKDKLPCIKDAKKDEGGEEDHFWELGQLLCLTIRLLGETPEGGQRKMLDDGAVELLCALTASFDRDGDGDVDASDMADETDIRRALDCSATFCNLAHCPENRIRLVQEGGLESILMLSRSPCVDTQWRCAAALRYLAAVKENRFTMVSHGGTTALIEIAKNEQAGEDTLVHCAHALHSMSKSVSGRQHMVAQGAVPVLLDLSKSSDDQPTKQNCAAALAFLSHASSTIEEGAIRSLIQMDKSARERQLRPTSPIAGHDDLLPPPLAETPLDPPPTTQLPEIKVRHDHIDKVFVGGGGPPPPPVDAPLHAPKYFTGKMTGDGKESSYQEAGFPKQCQPDERRYRPRVNSMMSQGNLHSVQPTPYASQYASRRQSSVDVAEQPRLPRASEIRVVLEEAVTSGEVDATPAEDKSSSAQSPAEKGSPLPDVQVPPVSSADASGRQAKSAKLPPVRARASGKHAAKIPPPATDGGAPLPLWAGELRPISSVNVWGKDVLDDMGAETNKQSAQDTPQDVSAPGSFGWQAAQLGLWS